MQRSRSGGGHGLGHGREEGGPFSCRGSRMWGNIKKAKSINIIPAKKQLLTHQVINGYFLLIELNTQPPILSKPTGSWLNNAELKKKAFPQFIHQFIGGKALQLQVL